MPAARVNATSRSWQLATTGGFKRSAPRAYLARHHAWRALSRHDGRTPKTPGASFHSGHGYPFELAKPRAVSPRQAPDDSATTARRHCTQAKQYAWPGRSSGLQSASTLETCRMGGPDGFRNEAALIRDSPGRAPLVISTTPAWRERRASSRAEGRPPSPFQWTGFR